MGDYLAGEEMRVSRCLAWGSALRASYFLLLRQKKVSKEKATPGSASGCTRSLALLDGPGGLLNSPAAQTTPADCTRPACVAQRLSRGPENHPSSTGVPHFWTFCAVDRNSLFLSLGGCAATSFRVPMWRAEQRRWAGGTRRGLSEGRRPEFRSHPARRVAQGSRRSRPHNLGSPSFRLLFLGEARKSTPALQARKPLPIAKRR
jgi:hypothetical protein